ncbi:MAG: acyl-CoA thioesterase [Thermoleophilia bacterium]|nr:acyl-CoA thioesterase [Thermoleophilia bacterium]
MIDQTDAGSIARVEGFPFVHRDVVRFADVDAMGHVNNAVFLTWMEAARTHFMLQRGLARGVDALGMILARAEVDFRSPVRFGEDIQVGVRPSRLGNKSFELAYEVRAGDRLAAEGTSVLVAYDYAGQESMALPERWRDALQVRA